MIRDGKGKELTLTAVEMKGWGAGVKRGWNSIKRKTTNLSYDILRTPSPL
jgi:hypothetical protein